MAEKKSAKSSKKKTSKSKTVKKSSAKPVSKEVKAKKILENSDSLKKSQKKTLSQFLVHWAIKIYLVTVLYFLVVYHFDYLKTRGFHDWVLFGLIFATVKAVFWPAQYWQEIVHFLKLK